MNWHISSYHLPTCTVLGPWSDHLRRMVYRHQLGTSHSEQETHLDVREMETIHVCIPFPSSCSLHRIRCGILYYTNPCSCALFPYTYVVTSHSGQYRVGNTDVSPSVCMSMEWLEYGNGFGMGKGSLGSKIQNDLK